MPSSESVEATCWPRSGLAAIIFLPRSAQFRSSQCISRKLSGGPTACEASDENGTRSVSSSSAVPSHVGTVAPGSRKPRGLRPLKNRSARPSQKFRNW